MSIKETFGKSRENFLSWAKALFLGDDIDSRSDTFTKKNTQALLERETFSDFLNMQEYIPVPKEDFGIFYCHNGYRGYCFEVSAPAKSTSSLHDEVISLLGQSLPYDSVIQMTFMPSRNIYNYVDLYKKGHCNPCNIKYPENVINIINESGDMILKAINGNLYSANNHNIFRPRNLRVIITFLIPELDKKNSITDFDIVEYALKSRSRLQSLYPHPLNHDDVLSFYNEILRPNLSDMPFWTVSGTQKTRLNEQVVSSSDVIEKYVGKYNYFTFTNKQNETTYGTTLTVKSFPDFMHIGKLDEILFDYNGVEPKNHLQDPFVVNLTIFIENKEKFEKKTVMKAQGNIYQTKMSGNLKEYMPELESRYSESVHVIKELNQNETILSSCWSISMFASEEKLLTSNVETLIKDAEKIKLLLQQESEIGLEVFLNSLPLNFDYQNKIFGKKFHTMLKQNNAVINTIYGAYPSMGSAYHGMPYFDRKGQMLFLDFFDQQHAGNNCVVSAPTRSGKTYFITHCALHNIANGGISFFMELQETLDGVCDAVGGKYIRFDEQKKICLNFFSDIATSTLAGVEKKIIHRDAMITIIPLIGLMIGKRLISSVEEDNKDENAAIFTAYIERAVNLAFEHKQFTCGMKDVFDELLKIANALEKENKRDIRLEDALVSLEPYAKKGGVYYDYFNGQKTEYFSDSSLTGIGLASLMDKGDLFPIVLMALTQSITNEFFNPKNAHIKKQLIVDEVWAMLKNPIFAAFIVRIFRTLNKFNGAGITISQDIDLYFTNSDLESIFNNATYKIFFKPKKDSLERLIEQKKLSSDPLFKEDMLSLKTLRGEYSEMLVYTEDCYSVGRIIATQYSFYLYSNADGAPEVFKLMEITNCSKHEASWILAFIYNNKINKDFSKDSPIPIKIGFEAFRYRKNLTTYEELSEEAKKYIS